jgi:1-acyl-sn-glycerol-3-phosphate acyltransferase
MVELTIIAVIFGVSAACFAALMLLARGPQDTLFVAFIRAVSIFQGKLFHRYRLVGGSGDPIPPAGPFIVVANHRSGVDPVLLSVVTRRRIRLLMAREYYEIPVLHTIFRALGCIPVNRNGNDLSATKAALKALREGQVIGIFPQGGIRGGDEEMEAKHGVAMLSSRTGAPIIPFYIDGSPHKDSVLCSIMTPSRTVIRAGPPTSICQKAEGKVSREELERLTASVIAAINSLKPAAGNGLAPGGTL